MKLNATPRHYMPLSQNQSDDDESGPSKEDKGDKQIFKNSFEASEGLSKRIRQSRAAEIDPKKLPMSATRLTMFILSLIFCVLFVVVFVFVMPCTMTLNLNRICHVTFKWRKVLQNMTFTSSLDIIDFGTVGKRFLLFGFDGTECGLVAIQESNGNEYWRLPLHSTPLATFCNEIDINSDGVKECLILGENGLLSAVDIRKGSALWYLHNHNELNDASSVNGPIIVPDVDHDGIMDIIISYNVGYGENSSHLAVVSGGTGQILGSLIELPQCNGAATTNFPIKIRNDVYFVLHCPEEKNNNLWLVSSKDIFDVAQNVTSKLVLKNNFRIPYFVNTVDFYAEDCYDNNLVIILDNKRFILLHITPQRTFKHIWETFIESEKNVRVLTSGQFVNGSNQLVVLSDSTVVGINLLDGKKMWSSVYSNGTVTSGVKLPNFFGDTDGLLLKEISSETNLGGNLSDQNTLKSIDGEVMKKSKRVFQETYILVKCGEMTTTKSISSEDVLSMCSDDKCSPDIYSANVTALIRPARLSTSLDMYTLTTALTKVHGAEETIIKRLNLENISSLPRCSG